MPEVLQLCVGSAVICIGCVIADHILPMLPTAERYLESLPMCRDEEGSVDYIDADYETVE